MTWRPGQCHGNGLECWSYARKRQMPCSLCNLTIGAGSVWAPKYTDFYSPAQLLPTERDYFCADCFQRSRPIGVFCECPEALACYAEHKNIKDDIVRRTRRPPGPPPGPLPAATSMPQPAGPPPGPFPFTTPQPPPGLPSTWLAIPTTSPHPGASSAASASAASASSAGGDDMHLDRPEILAQVVERLQQEMREMREQLQLLENTVRGIVIGNAVAELGLRRAP